MVVRKGRQQGIGDAEVPAAGAEEDVGIVGDFLLDGGVLALPVGEQLVQGARVKRGACEDVRAWLGAFFQHDDREFSFFCCGQLLEADGCGKACRTSAYDDHVVFHGFSRAEFFNQLLGGHVLCLTFGVGG